MFQLQSEILSQVFKNHVQLSWGKFLPDNSKLYVSSRLKITAKFKVHYLFYLHELKILWKFLLINNTNFRGANRWFFNTNLEISHGNIFSFLFLTLFSCFSDLLQWNIRIFDWAIRVSSDSPYILPVVSSRYIDPLRNTSGRPHDESSPVTLTSGIRSVPFRSAFTYYVTF